MFYNVNEAWKEIKFKLRKQIRIAPSVGATCNLASYPKLAQYSTNINFLSIRTNKCIVLHTKKYCVSMPELILTTLRKSLRF